MLRTVTNSTLLLARVTTNGTKCGQTEYALEFVRWRKPRWHPVAKSKLFRVPERTKQNPEEQAELKRLHNNYKTQIRSVRQYLREEARRLTEVSTADHYVLTPEQETTEMEACLKINAEWNKASAEVRAKRLAQQSAERVRYVKERLELARERDEERLERIEAMVRREKELAKTHIKREQLDDAIASALANPIDHNFSIDLQGNLHRGRFTANQTPEQLQASNCG